MWQPIVLRSSIKDVDYFKQTLIDFICKEFQLTQIVMYSGYIHIYS